MIDILGSCVTRDAFRFNKEIGLGRYYARTSLVSLYSKPIDIKIDEIDLPSRFNQRMVFYDLTKEFRRYIKSSKSSVLILDFIDERFHILKCGSSYITFSNEFNKSNLLATLKGYKVPWEIKKKLWEDAALKFIEEIYQYYDVVILHKAYWQNEYIDSDGNINHFKNKPIDERNLELDFYYNVIENNFKDIEVIKINDMKASATHKWGLTPYHYEDNYYIQFNNELKRIIDKL